MIYTDDIFANDFGGLGDTQVELFFSPANPGPDGLIWGVGPIFNIPTATDSRLGTNEWGAGPTAVALIQKGPWTIGGLANHLWTFGDGDINQTFVQPWLNYTFGNEQSVTLQSQSSYDWNTEKWTVPLTLTYQQVVNVGAQAVQWQLGGSYLLTAPDEAPNWGIQAGLTFLFPTKEH